MIFDCRKVFSFIERFTLRLWENDLKILITGATGFIGKNIAQDLLRDGEEVYALARPTSKIDFLRKIGVKFVFGDITDPISLNAITGKFEAVIHCAAYVNDKNRQKLSLVNIMGTENVCQLCLRLSVRRLVYLSSAAVVSGHFQVPLAATMPYRATNFYGLSKIEAEKIVWNYRQKGLASAILRPPMVYGEEEPHLFKLILFLLKHRLFPLIAGGRNKLHLAYVKNVAQSAVMALRNDGFLNGAFFTADKEVLTIREICSILTQAISARQPFVLPAGWTSLLSRIPRLGRRIKFFIKDRVYDISPLEKLGYAPRFKTQEALDRSARYFYNDLCRVG